MNIIAIVLLILTVIAGALWIFGVPKNEAAVRGILLADAIYLLWQVSHIAV